MPDEAIEEKTEEKVEESKPEVKEAELTKDDIEWIKKQRQQPAATTSETNPPTIQKVEVMTVSDETIEAPLTETEKTEVKPTSKRNLKAKRRMKRLW